VIARANGLRRLVIVSDGTHLFRIHKICAADGLDVLTSPPRANRRKHRRDGPHRPRDDKLFAVANAYQLRSLAVKSMHMSFEQLCELHGRQWHAEIVALRLVAILRFQESQFFSRLNALGNHP
jgi:hypothetical protein